MAASFENPVKIGLRERTSKQLDIGVGESVITNIDDNIIVVDSKPFEVDYILNDSQNELFLKIGKPLVIKTLNGYNTTCLAYGQTGTGKTFSMGLNQFDYNDKNNFGIIPRALEEVFDNINCGNLINSNEILVTISYVEIYNEKVYDMFNERTSEAINLKGCRFLGGVQKEICNINDAFTLLKKGNLIRHVRPTKLNRNSSRSHAIFTIHIFKNYTRSCLNLVDLAGSEGIKRTGHIGIARNEGVNINQGLLSIGKVLQAIISKNTVIPYRDSVLTTVLQGSLNSNSFLTLLACVSSSKEDLSETLATLRFAQNAKKLKYYPKLNNLLNSLKKKPTKTPLNCFKRASNLNEGKKPLLRSNTFFTPNKKSIISHKLNNIQSATSSNTNCLSSNNESLYPQDSFMSFNVSTSTALDVPENKLQVNNKITLGTARNSSPIKTLTELPWTDIRTEIKEVVRAELKLNENDFIIINNDENGIKLCNSCEDLYYHNKIIHKTLNKTINPTKKKLPKLNAINLRKSAILSLIDRETFSKKEPKCVRKSIWLNRKKIEDNFSPIVKFTNIRRSIRIKTKTAEEIDQMNNTREKLNKLPKIKANAQNLFYTKSSNNITMKQHSDFILNLLNTGSMKEIQILPQIGLKTAYQIITYRTLNGRFENFQHIGTLPFWRGKGWERFKMANYID